MKDKIVAFIRAALAVGRNYNQVIDLLNESEIRDMVMDYCGGHTVQTLWHLRMTRAPSSGPFAQHKIYMIKAVRDLTGCGLRDAKDFCEGTITLKVNSHQKTAITVFIQNAYFEATHAN